MAATAYPYNDIKASFIFRSWDTDGVMHIYCSCMHGQAAAAATVSKILESDKFLE